MIHFQDWFRVLQFILDRFQLENGGHLQSFTSSVHRYHPDLPLWSSGGHGNTQEKPAFVKIGVFQLHNYIEGPYLEIGMLMSGQILWDGLVNKDS